MFTLSEHTSSLIAILARFLVVLGLIVILSGLSSSGSEESSELP
jgi:hypothetical protein